MQNKIYSIIEIPMHTITTELLHTCTKINLLFVLMELKYTDLFKVNRTVMQIKNHARI